jgi:hypothetical protein
MTTRTDLGTSPTVVGNQQDTCWGFVLISVGTPLVGFGPLLANVLGLIGAVMMGLGYSWLGYALWKNPTNSGAAQAGQ